MLDLEKITLNVREIALRAGAFLRNERSGFDRSKVEKKNAHDYVSYVDKESERRIVAQLRELLPEAGFIAEEGSGSLTTENVSIRPRACFFPLFSFLPLWLHYNLNPLCVQY